MRTGKLATSSLPKINIFWNKNYDVIHFICDVTNKILSHESNYIEDAAMSQKFGKSGLVCHLGLVLGKASELYNSVVKTLKQKFWKFLGLIFTFGEVAS